MKKFKLIPAVTFLLIFAVYFGVYNTYGDGESFEKLELNEKITYLKLEENDRIKIIGLPQDSIVVKPDFSDSAVAWLPKVSANTYQVYQEMSEQGTDVSQKIFYFKRLLLAIFIFIIGYLDYTKKFKFNISFQKILFENVKKSLLFALFSITAFLLTQYIRDNIGSPSYMAQMLLGDGLDTLKYGLLWSIFVAIFIYFEPRNIHWYKKKLAKREANAAKAQEQADLSK